MYRKADSKKENKEEIEGKESNKEEESSSNKENIDIVKAE